MFVVVFVVVDDDFALGGSKGNFRKRVRETTLTTTRRTGKIVCCTHAVYSMTTRLPRPSSKILRTLRRDLMIQEKSERSVCVVLFVLTFENCKTTKNTTRYRETDGSWIGRIHQYINEFTRISSASPPRWRRSTVTFPPSSSKRTV